MIDWASPAVSRVLENALAEDRATEDATTLACIGADQLATAVILAKQECVLAGIGVVARMFEIFAQMEGSAGNPAEVVIPPEIADGVCLRKGQQVAFIRHRARAILSCERTILNLLQRMSVIASITRRYVDAIAGTRSRILDTRKTVPGLRLLDKYAVHCGGGQNHRMDLEDGILVKNNHIDLAGGVRTALQRALRNRQGGQTIEVEVRSLEELEAALQYGAEAILLDNMSPEQVRRAVERVAAYTPEGASTVPPSGIGGAGRGRVPLEASGGITLENVRAYAEAGVDYISIGALTHSPRAVDLSMRISPA
jgi:nicotinate-nucleotide pyrophosphorylase (carboxylating)